MRNPVVRLVLCAALLLGCSATESDSKPVDTEPAGGKTGSGGAAGSGDSGESRGGSGGQASTAGSGGSAAGAGGTSAPAGGAGGSSTPSPAADAGSEPSPAADASAPPSAAGAPYGCTGCKPIFDGKTLEGWETANPEAWVARDGLLASTGKADDIWTKADYGSFRIFFQVRQERGNHKPGTLFFGQRPAAGAKPRRGLGGAQFQPPNGASWNYGAGGKFNRLVNPNFDVTKWHQCEVLVKEAGSFRAACCAVTDTPCKATEVLRWEGNGKKAPFGIQMHNGGLFDEYKEIWVEENPTVDELLSMK